MRCKHCGNDHLDSSKFCAICGNPVGVSSRGGETPTGSRHFSPYQPLQFSPGDIFAERYRIVSEIGRGGMGRVFRALDQVLDIEIAIKIIRTEFLDDERMVKRFKNEILLAREVSHENVVRIHDFCEWHGLKYITMQFVDGCTLRDLIDESGPLPVDRIQTLAVQICHGLEAARKKGIAHRDLKPQNILIDQNGQAYIADFGLAKGMSQSGLSVSGVILGTPEYIAPEQWRGERGDSRSDIYSLGVMLYEMVTGRPLFEADSELGFLHKHLNETPSFRSEEKRRIPDYLRRIILRCLAKDPSSRYQCAADMENDLIAQKAPKLPFAIQSARWLHSRVWLGAVLVILILGSWSLWQLRRKTVPIQEMERSLIVLPFANNTGEERYAFWSKALADLLTIDLAQSRHIRLTGRIQFQTFFNRYSDWTPRQTLNRDQLDLLRKESGSDFVLLGEINQAGNRFRVSARIVSLNNGEIRGSFQSEGLGEESLFTMIDSLTDKTKLAFNLSREMILQGPDKDIRQITTRSLDALKAYSTAKDYSCQGKHLEAVAEYEKAIAIDPDFALAYADAARIMGYSRDSRQKLFYDQALALSERISHRERLLIEGRYLDSVKSDLSRALERFRQVLGEYPDDVDAWEQYAAINRRMENWAESSRAYRELERLNPGRAVVSANLFGNELMQGRFGAALEILERYKNELQRASMYHELCFLLLFNQGLLNQAESELALVEAESGDSSRVAVMAGNLRVLRGQLDQAGEQYLLVGRRRSPPHLKIPAINGLINLSLHRGRLREALAWLEGLKREALDSSDISLVGELESDRLRLLALQPDRALQAEAMTRMQNQLQVKPEDQDYSERFTDLYTLGRLQISSKAWSELDSTLEEMDTMIAVLGRFKARYPLHLRALAALDRGELTEAENFYHQAQKLFPNPDNPDDIADFAHTLAQIKTAGGDNEEAVAIYETIIAKNSGRLDNAAAFVTAHIELARLQLKTGRTARARETASRVIQWWDGGDWAPEAVAEMKKIALIR